jgi:uncharacterized membrane protein
MFYTTETVPEEPCSVNLPFRTAAILGSVFGMVMLILETRSLFIRYCACQSIFIWGAWLSIAVATRILSAIPLVGILFDVIGAAVSLAAIAAFVLLAHHAAHNLKIIVPGVHRICEEWSRIDS